MSKKNPEDLVKELLENFQDAAPSLPATIPDDRTTVSEPLFIDESDVGPFCNPESLIQLLTLFISVLGTVAASSFTGYAYAVYSDILPEIGRKLRELDKIPEGHVKFVKKLVKKPLMQIAKEDAMRPPEEQRVPVLLKDLIEKELAIGLTMYHLGKINAPLKPDAVSSVLHKITLDLLKNGGVSTSQGLLPERLPEIIKEAVDEAIEEFENSYGPR